jgi:hypothetical protein
VVVFIAPALLIRPQTGRRDQSQGRYYRPSMFHQERIQQELERTLTLAKGELLIRLRGGIAGLVFDQHLTSGGL